MRDDNFLYILNEQPPEALRPRVEEAVRACPWRHLWRTELRGTIVVVGASLAGLRAVETLRQQGYDGRLVSSAPSRRSLRPPAALQAGARGRLEPRPDRPAFRRRLLVARPRHAPRTASHRARPRHARGRARRRRTHRLRRSGHRHRLPPQCAGAPDVRGSSCSAPSKSLTPSAAASMHPRGRGRRRVHRLRGRRHLPDKAGLDVRCSGPPGSPSSAGARRLDGRPAPELHPDQGVDLRRRRRDWRVRRRPPR